MADDLEVLENGGNESERSVYHEAISDAATEDNAVGGKSKKEKVPLPEEKVPVRIFFLLKHIIDNKDDQLFLIGTLIQNVFHSMNADDGDESTSYFHLRFNDLIADNDSGYSKVRNHESLEDSSKTTFQMTAPLEVDVDFDYFPFKIYTATLLVELSTRTEKTKRIRPELWVAKNDVRNNVTLQSPYLKDGIKKKNKEERTELYKDKMDKMKDYDFVSPCPKVEYIYDQKNECCHKCRLTFYLVEGGISKWVGILVPMLLVFVLDVVNVFYNDTENGDTLSTSATLALTAVFLLPNILSKAYRPKIIATNMVYILLVFIGLALSSVTHEMQNSKIAAYTGVALFGFSFIIPIVSFFKFSEYKQSILEEEKSFMKNDLKHEKFKHDVHDYKEYFQSMKDVMEGQCKLYKIIGDEFGAECL